MPWTLNKNGVTHCVSLTAAEQLKPDALRNTVRAEQAPNVAARARDSNQMLQVGGHS